MQRERSQAPKLINFLISEGSPSDSQRTSKIIVKENWLVYKKVQQEYIKKENKKRIKGEKTDKKREDLKRTEEGELKEFRLNSQT